MIWDCAVGCHFEGRTRQRANVPQYLGNTYVPEDYEGKTQDWDGVQMVGV